MGITSKKQEDIPNEFQPFPHEMKNPEAPEFATIPVFDNTIRDPKTGVGIPSEQAVKEIKNFMNINKQ